MKRISIYALFSACFIASFVAFDFFAVRADLIGNYKQSFSEMAYRLDDEVVVSRGLLDARQDLSELKGFLESRQRKGALDFWAILHQEKLYQSNIPKDELELYRFYLDRPGKLHIAESKADGVVSHGYVTGELGNGFQLVVGLKYLPNEFFWRHFNAESGFLIKYLAGTITLAVLIFVFFFRDIMESVRLVSRGGGRSFDNVRVRSKEAEVLLRGFSAYENGRERLELERDLLKWQVLPSLRTEMMSGRKPPYDFLCTLVRTDINNFSKIYNEHSVDDFTSTINEFFTDVSHIVAKHNGLVHEFVGDEVLFYFKDEVAGNSVAVALFALQEINLAAEKYNQKTLKERGYPFTVKSSLAHGSIRFGPFVNGFNLAGSILIETVRILSNVVEKEGNVVVFGDRHSPRLDGLASLRDYGTARLKGFQGEVRLVALESLCPLQERLGKDEPRALADLGLYRSDASLAEILRWLRKESSSDKASLQIILKTIGGLRRLVVTRTNGEPQRVLVEWVEQMLTKAESSKHLGTQAMDHLMKTLASSLRLFENLMPKENFDPSVESLLRRAMLIDDRRVIANALDALTHFKSEGDLEFSKQLVDHGDNRVAANALVLEGIRSISPFVIKRLKKMLESQRSIQIASALYALGEIASHHRSNDHVYYNTQVGFQRIVHSLTDFITSDDPMVRRQAFIAAKKTNEPKILDEVELIISAQPESELAREARMHLGDLLSERQSKSPKAA